MKKRARKKATKGTRRRRWKELCEFNGTRSRKDWKWHSIHDAGKLAAGSSFIISSMTIVMPGN